MEENINKKITKEISDFCKSIFDKYPNVTGFRISGKNSNNITISTKLIID